MFPSFKTLLAYITIIGILGAIWHVLQSQETQIYISVPRANTPTTTPLKLSNEKATSTEAVLEEKENMTTSLQSTVAEELPTSPPSDEKTESESTVHRIQNPYDEPSRPFEKIDPEARTALVNILCITTMRGIQSTIASGVIIDKSGVILTNAHVGQYVLLSQDPDTGMSCEIRSGSPARSLWRPEIAYISPSWVEQHATDITSAHSSGTGEYDYALLRITGTLDGSPLPDSFPFLSPDTREGIAFLNDQVLAVSYPAEFISGNVQNGIYPLSTVTSVQSLLTFDTNTIDLISIGAIAGAQGGSSGGAVVNAWGRLVGIITTTTEGKTTAERILRAITLPYISRDLQIHTGLTLAGFLNGDIEGFAKNFNTTESPSLISALRAAITARLI